MPLGAPPISDPVLAAVQWQPWHPWLTGGLVVGMVVVLAKGRYGTDLVIMGVLTALLLAGVLDLESAVQGFANPAVITVALLYVVATGMRETGAMQLVASRVIGRPKSTLQAQARLAIPVALMSAFVNNTPIVAMFLPVLQGIAKRCRLAASQLYMPLSFASILGGVCTLIGTSTNIVVADALTQAVDTGVIAVEQGEKAPAISMFTLSLVGVPIMICGLGYMLLFGRRLLPNPAPDEGEGLPAADDKPPEGYHAALTIARGSPIAGKTVEAAGLRSLPGLFLSSVDRDDQSIVVGPNFVLAEGDVLIFVGRLDSIVDLQTIRGLEPTGNAHDEPLYRPNLKLHEAVVAQRSELAGRTIKQARIRTRFGAAVIAVRRQGQELKGKIGDITLRAGDILLLEAPKGAAERFADSDNFYLVSEREGSAALRHERGWIAMAILVALVVTITAGWLSTMVAAMTAAGLMIVTRCCTGPQARSGVDFQLLVTIGAAFGIGEAMQSSGLAQAIADFFVNLAGPLGHHALLATVYIVTLAFTMTMTNNAAAILMFPIAIDMAASAGLNPMPFAVAIAIAASCEFSSPIGYQTNLMVMGPGNYSWMDFTRFGMPLNVIACVLCVAIAPLIWPF
ncbi:MAG: SLC13 family permease [Phycisphaerales bacterium JB040]